MPGYFYKTTKVKDDAVPIDDITKFAWDDDDYIEVEEWHEYTEEELAMFEEGKKIEAQRAWLEDAPDIQDEQDEAICTLYERQLEIEDRMDEAICEMYETFIMGKDE